MDRAGRWAGGIAVVAVLGLVGACGGGAKSQGASPASPTTPTTAPAPTTPPTPAGPAEIQGAQATVRAFMDSRVAGAGAEGYLFGNAKAMYSAQVKLYDVANYSIGVPDGSDQRAILLPVAIRTASGTMRLETLTVGAGQTETVPRLAFVIRSVAVT